MRTVAAQANWRQVRVSVILELRVFALARGDEMSGRIFAPLLRRLMMALPAALLAVMTVRPAAAPKAQSQDQPSSGPQSQSIAEAARRSREKAKNTTKASKVITDDDLDKENIKPGAQGLTVDTPPKLETQPPTPEAVAEAAATPTVPPDPATASAPSDDPEITRLKDLIADAEKDAELSRRDLALQQDTVFSNPDYQHDNAGKAKLAALQQQINDKQQDVDRLKTRLAAMEELQKKKRAKRVARAPAPSDQNTNSGTVPPTSPQP
jgi:flagellar motility protein MotE (MotC chaperone)